MADVDTTSSILVIGPCSTPDELADLTAAAYDVADRFHVRAVVANGMDYVVSDYAAVMVDENAFESVSAAVLWAEAQEAGVLALDFSALDGLTETVDCLNCLTAEDDQAEPQLVAGTWTPAVCVHCAPDVRKAERARQRSARKLALVA